MRRKHRVVVSITNAPSGTSQERSLSNPSAVNVTPIPTPGIIPDDLRKCRTTLIPKGGNLKEIKNWRPITITSLLLRILNKILATRLNKFNLHYSQKGFRNIDGCLANILLIQNVIKQYRTLAKPYNIITIDIKKAFDIVQHKNIKTALERIGINERVRKLIDNQYKEVSTTITCGKNITGEIPIKRGVKQGDHLSPFIFNCIIDDFLTNAKQEYGVNINNTWVSTLAYADDIVLLSESTDDAQYLIDDLITTLEKKGLSINVDKCTALTTMRVPAKKKLFVETNNIFRCRDKLIPQIQVEGFFKYLGKNFSFTGISKCNVHEIIQSLNNLQKAPLKPNHKLTLLKKFFIPKIIHCLQFPKITKKTLKIVDPNIRRIVKAFLHIPSRTSSEFLYARTKDGGLGILTMNERIPVILYNRIKKLILSNDPITYAAINITSRKKSGVKTQENDKW